MMRRFGPEGPHGPLRDPRRGIPEPTGAWTALALGFTAVTSLAVAGVSELVLLPVAWAVATLTIVIGRRA